MRFTKTILFLRYLLIFGAFLSVSSPCAAASNIYSERVFANTTQTYDQIDPPGTRAPTFQISNASLTLTGANNPDHLLSTKNNVRITMGAPAAPTTLRLTQGTLPALILMQGNDNHPISLITGSGLASNLPTVNITGNIGANQGSIYDEKIKTIVETDGAHLNIGGYLGGNGYIDLVHAKNGSITLAGNDHSQIRTLSIESGQFLRKNDTNRLVLFHLDLKGSAMAESEGSIVFYGQQDGGMQAQSVIHSTQSDIIFQETGNVEGKGGFINASGKVWANNNIIATYHDQPFDLTKANAGSFILQADTGDIGAHEIRADEIHAPNGKIIAGSYPSAGDIPVFLGKPFNYAPPPNESSNALTPFTPTQKITATIIKANGIAAGELTDMAGRPSRIEAARLLVVKNTGAVSSTGNFTLHNGSFNLTGTQPIGQAEYAENGSIITHNESAWIGGNMSVNNSGSSAFTTLGVGGSTRISGGALSGETLNTASATLHDGLQARIANLNITDSASGFMAIGGTNDKAVTQAAIENLSLNGRDLRVGAGGGSAQGAIGSFSINGTKGSLTNGDIFVGHNGMLALGTTSTSWLPNAAALGGASASSAVLGVYAPIVLGAGLHVDSAWSHPGIPSRMARAAAGGIDFSSNSLLVIDGSQNGVNYGAKAVPTANLPDDVPGALSASSPAIANVQGGAKIYIDHVTPGHTYVALGRNISTVYDGPTAWKGANLLSSNPLLGLDRLENGMEGQFGVTEKAPHIKQLTAASGVPRMARAASEAMESAIYHRIRLGHEDLYRRNFALWALPLYEHISEFGMDGGNSSYGYDGGIGGLAIGCDYTWENAFRLGFALNIGAGYARSTGEVATTKNHLDFWGIGAYGVWKPGAFSLDAEIDFTSTYNKLKQELPAGLGDREIKADIPAWGLGMSLRAQYEFDTDWLIIRPHFGVRYFHLDSSPYDATMGGRDVLRTQRSYQNVWTFPVGVVFTKNFRLGDGYEITPLVNLKAIPASGDTFVKNTVRYTGSHQDINMETQVMDDITYGGRAGIEFRAGNFNVGINYTAQFGAHTSNQGVFGVLRYEF